jgi:uncharacterized protein YggE
MSNSNSKTSVSRTFFTIVSWVAALALLVVIVIELGVSNSTKGTIAVTGTATVTGAPDTAAFSIGVTTTRLNASAALLANNQKMSEIQKALLSSGVTKQNLQTSNLSIYPNTNSNGVVTGFSVTDTLNVTTHQMRKVGQIINAGALAAGQGVNLGGITFSISNDSALLAQARVAAVHNAHLEATDIASAARERVGSIIRIVDQETQPTIVYTPTEFAAGAAHSVPVQSGTDSLSIQVSVRYSISK